MLQNISLYYDLNKGLQINVIHISLIQIASDVSITKNTSIAKCLYFSNISFSIVKLNIQPREMNAFKMIIPFLFYFKLPFCYNFSSNKLSVAGGCCTKNWVLKQKNIANVQLRNVFIYMLHQCKRRIFFVDWTLMTISGYIIKIW